MLTTNPQRREAPLEPARTLIDPLLPPEGIVLRSRPYPEKIVLTNRHHYRDSGTLQAEGSMPVLCSEKGLHEFEGGPEVEGFAFGDELAEGVVNYDELRFVPDHLLGDYPGSL